MTISMPATLADAIRLYPKRPFTVRAQAHQLVIEDCGVQRLVAGFVDTRWLAKISLLVPAFEQAVEHIRKLEARCKELEGALSALEAKAAS